MPTLQQLIAQKDALDQQIQALQRSQRADAIGQVRALMSQHGLTVADLSDPGGRRSAGASAGSGKVAAK